MLKFLRERVDGAYSVTVPSDHAGSYLVDIFHYGEGRGLEQVARASNKSPMFAVAILSILSHSYLSISCMHLLSHYYMFDIVLYACTHLKQESNEAPQLLFKRNHEEKFRILHRVHGFIS